MAPMTRHSVIRRASVPVALLLVITTACAEAEQTSTPGASVSAGATSSVVATPIESTATAEPSAPPPTPAPPTSSSNTFSLLPADPPPGDPSQISCSGDIGPSDQVAVVSLKGTRRVAGPTVLRDYSDPANPRTVCEFGSEGFEQLIDARHVVIENCDGPACVLAVVDLPEVRYHWFALPTNGDTTGDFIAVSPSLDEVAWSSAEGFDGPDQNRRLHLARADGDHVVARFFPVGGRCGTGDDSKLGAYSRSGEHMYALDVPMPSTTVFVGLDGLERVFMFRPPGGNWPDAAYPAMPVWSVADEALYYRRDGSVWKWTPSGGEELFLDGIGWQFPTISPDGRYLAYAVLQDDGRHDAFLIDLQAGGEPVLIGEERTMPVFLTATQLWFKSDNGGGCVTQQESHLIYDVNESAESRSIIESVQAVWPATSSNA
jgi:hypothetical protein